MDYLNLVMMMMMLMLMIVSQGLRQPAPFSDDLEPVDKPYKRVSMDEAKQGTSREWDFQKKIFPNPKLPSRFHQALIIVYLWYGCILKEGSRIEMPHLL